MTRLWRILQLTTLAIVFMVVMCMAFFVIEWGSGGRLQRWHSAPFTGSVGDESIAIELVTLPVVLASLACCGVVKLFRLRAVHNEVNDTFRPVLSIALNYGRFLLIVVAAIYLLMGHGMAALAHLAIALVMFTPAYREYRAQQRAIQERLQHQAEEEEGDDSPEHVA